MNKEEISVNEIYELIGRNIIVFQSIEIFLTKIHTMKGGKGTEKDLNVKKKKISKMSFGDLIDEKQINRHDKDYEDVDSPKVIFSFDFLPDINILNDIQQKLKKFASSRNQLVHKFQYKYNLTTKEGREEAKEVLDNEYKQLAPLKEELRNILKVLANRTEDYIATMNSDEFLAALEHEKNQEY